MNNFNQQIEVKLFKTKNSVPEL